MGVRARAALGVSMTLLGLGLVLVARAVRPLPHGSAPSLVLLFGSLPNLGVGLGMPFTVDTIGLVLKRRLAVARHLSLGVGCVVALAFAVVVEYGSRAVWGIAVDGHDLLASAVGVVVPASIATWAFSRRESKPIAGDRVTNE